MGCVQILLERRLADREAKRREVKPWTDRKSAWEKDLLRELLSHFTTIDADTRVPEVSMVAMKRQRGFRMFSF